MKKLKIIVVNLILFLILFHILDFYCSTIHFQYSWIYENYSGLKIVQYIKHYKQQHKYSIKFDEELANEQILTDKYCDTKDASPKWGVYRPIENRDAQNSILIFGCSFAYGDSLTNQETFSYNLGKYLPNYTIYNRAQDGWSTSHMLYQFENKKFSNMKNLKYVIYVFIGSHFVRNNYYQFVVPISPYYKNTKFGFVKLQKYTPKYIVCPAIITVTSKIHNLLNIPVNLNLTKNIILSSKEIIDYGHKGTKFILLSYENNKYDKMFEELKKEGIIVVSVNDLSNANYFIPPYKFQDWHPTPKAWREITPLFVKYMQDRGYLKD